MYSIKNFSIPSECCFEEKHDWGVTRPTVLVLVRDGNSFLYLDNHTNVEFPQTELALGEKLTQATERVLDSLGYASEEGRDNFVGYCAIGRRRIPHFLVIHFVEKGIRRKRGTAWIDPITEVVNHRVFGTVSQSLLSLLAKMSPDDCLGWGDDGLIVWPCEERATVSSRAKRIVAERLAA